MSATSASAPRGMRRSGAALVISQVRYDGLSFMRNRQGRFFTLALPVLFLILLCSIFGNGTVRVPGGTIKESTYYVPGLVALGVIQASFMSLVISVTAQRESGVLKRRRSTPVPAWVLIASRALICVGTAYVLLSPVPSCPDEFMPQHHKTSVPIAIAHAWAAPTVIDV